MAINYLHFFLLLSENKFLLSHDLSIAIDSFGSTLDFDALIYREEQSLQIRDCESQRADSTYNDQINTITDVLCFTKNHQVIS